MPVFCNSCGTESREGDSFCAKCGSSLVAMSRVMSESIARRTNGFAIAALVLGLVGMSPLAIIFGVLSLKQIGQDPNLDGRGMAIAGLVLGILGTIGLFLWGSVIGLAVCSMPLGV
ncbi:MAG: DUF4190 domain-containing protein [Dehalococcoidia bacterium]|nr:DUF4190 domain-containing protein [Dehalococcoidia bacterium]